MKKLTLSVLSLAFFGSIFANDDTLQVDDEQLQALMEYAALKDSVDSTFHWQYGDVTLGNNIATIHVPEGYKFLGPDESKYVLTELWGNPQEETLGMLFIDSISPLSFDIGYAVEITYSDEGYISDDDAEDMDYDELLLDMQSDLVESNKQRKQLGYSTYDLVGWAASPYYDQNAKKLHWAMELNFEDSEINTLNYNIRVLGRKGYLVLNAIGDITVLPQFEKDVDNILSSVEFNTGNRYEEFDPELDKVAAYGIGGLIAGKVLTKVGFFALIAKFWKFIALGVVGVFAAIRKTMGGKKKEETQPQITNDTTEE